MPGRVRLHRVAFRYINYKLFTGLNSPNTVATCTYLIQVEIISIFYRFKSYGHPTPKSEGYSVVPDAPYQGQGQVINPTITVSCNILLVTALQWYLLMERSSSYVDLYHWSRIQKGSYDNNLSKHHSDSASYRVWPISIQYVQFNSPTREMFRNICVLFMLSSDVCINWKMRMKAQPEIKRFCLWKKLKVKGKPLKTQGEKFFLF